MRIQDFEVPVENLTTVCDPDSLGFETTSEVDHLEGTIGQDRALSALELAVDIEAEGYNLFVSGIPGSGRNTALRTYLQQVASTKPNPPDWGYVHNFEDPSQPLALSMTCGMMRQLSHDMDELTSSCRHEIPRAFETDDYSHQVDDVMQEIQEKRQSLTAELEQQAQTLGFGLTFTQVGITPVPLIEGRQMTQEEFAALSDEVREGFRGRAEELQHEIAHLTREMRRLNKEASDRVNGVDTEVVKGTLSPIVDELQEKYADFPEVVDYLNQVEEDMVQNIEVFKPHEAPQMPALPFPMPTLPTNGDDFFVRYKVNCLVDNTNCQGGPVIFEFSPTYYNLFGRIDYRARMGTFTTDLTMIKSGALHRANGGYLVLQARDVLLSPLSWEALKRSLRSGEVRVENIGEQNSPMPSSTLRPQAIPINAKVVMVGSPQLIQMLRAADEDVRRYFKVNADFDTAMDRNEENEKKYASFVASRSNGKTLLPFHKTAVAKVIDYSSRLVENQEKLTTRFMEIADVLTEANYWAGKAGGSLVMGEHVTEAIKHKRYRLSLTEDHLQELIENGTIHISTDGKSVGQVNGLAVYSMGDYAFGKPSRISARVSLGRGQLVNIERETQLSGKIHNKGFMILTGYMNGQYGQDKPLSLSASIGFEQTYSEIDGDSASSTELYSLISALSGMPLDQGIAVTGSVNQAGEVQAIGGATFKIEGFFDVCKAAGFTGSQGVMVPKDNVKNLMLNEDVAQAVSEGKFHIYAVRTIDEGLEVLTGVAAGERQEDGSFPKGTVHHAVEARLEEFSRKARAFAGSDNEENHSSDAEPSKPAAVDEEPEEPNEG
ncbi:MAG: ATP-binding protein [Chloroflexi bacterium]|nr:ATP-binding protein [Chloroflexota bacterium]MDA1228680.1 ATP-binding protein [Chloroflexota bacterium]